MPRSWDPPSYQRWSKAFDRAIRDVWPEYNDHNPPKIFTISEPSAAASYCLVEENHQVEDGNCVMVIDAGGGTIEILLFQKTAEGWEQCFQSDAATCGGNSLNENIRKLATEKLRKYAPYIAEGPDADGTIESITEGKVVGTFEGDHKRSIRALNSKDIVPFTMHGLKLDPKNGFGNQMELSEKEWRRIFNDSLTGLEKLIKNQHSRIKKRNLTVHHVCWMGQFSDNDILRSHGEEVFDSLDWPNHVKPLHVHLRGVFTIAVAGGGIRAYVEKNAPGRRFLSASFAVMRHYPRPMHGELCSKALWNAKFEKGHDGQYYAFNRLAWFAEAGTEFTCDTPFTYESTHLFPVEGDGPWEARESLYYSSKKMKPGDPRLDTDRYNKESYVLGEVTFNMNRLQDLIKYLPRVANGDTSNPRKHFEVRLLVSVTASDGFFHELRVAAKWNPEDDTGILYSDVIPGADMNIAAAFKLTNV